VSRLQAAIVTACAIVVALAAVAAVFVDRHEAEQQRKQDERIACGEDTLAELRCRGTGG
jgi:hypothetical protein